jgi:hypothetical protein
MKQNKKHCKAMGRDQFRKAIQGSTPARNKEKGEFI